MSSPLPTAHLSPAQRRQLEAWLLEFDQQWRRGLLAVWCREIPAELSAAEPLALCEIVKIDLERNWSDGFRKPVEDYLAELPQLGTAKTITVDLLLAEYEARRMAGETDPFRELSRRFPDRAESLQRLLDAEEPHRSFSRAVAVSRQTGRSQSDTHSVVGKAGRPLNRETLSESHPKHADEMIPERFGRYQIEKPL